MPTRLPTAGEIKMRCNLDIPPALFTYQLRHEGAKLINLIHGAAQPRNDLTNEQTAEWARMKAVAITQIQLGTLAAIEAESI